MSDATPNKPTGPITRVLAFYFNIGLGGVLGMWFGALAFFLPLAFIADAILGLDGDLFNPLFMLWCGAAGGYMVGEVGKKKTPTRE